MTIHLPEDLERSVLAQVESGQFRSADDLVAHAVRSYLQQPKAPQADPSLGSIGAMRDAADELDQIVADAMKHRREETVRDISVSDASVVPDPVLGCMREDAALIDEIVADAYRHRREETWREIEL
jgi:Arc/MetJ-type ribon-helix-helix transcriptional regulator